MATTATVLPNRLRRLWLSVKSQGLLGTSHKLSMVMADHLFDLRYRVNTCGWARLHGLTIASENKGNGYSYEPAKVVLIRKLLGIVRPFVPSDSVLVDFGCGKGRVLLVASEFGFKGARGIEFASELCKVARQNVAAFRRQTSIGTELSVIEADASNYRISEDEYVFFMFNPFDETVLSPVMDHIEASLQRYPRRVFIIYQNPKWKNVIETRESFFLMQKLDLWGNHFNIYQSRDRAAEMPRAESLPTPIPA
jgi:SAM-dependent methyltransferase